MNTEQNIKNQINLMYSQGYSTREIFEILVKGGYSEDRVSKALGGK